MFKLKIGQKSLGLFLVISLLPLAVINTYWLHSEQSTLRSAASVRQSMLTTDAADHVDQFISTKINTVILHSQTASVQQFDIGAAQQELTSYLQQDSDLERVSLVDTKGQERTAITKSGPDAQLANVYDSDAFRATTFLAGKEYISGVTFNQQQQPIITIAVPLVSFETRQSLANLSTAEPGLIRNNNDIKGVLIAQVNLKDLWQSVLSTRLGSKGYAYVVDAQGRLIAYPDSTFIKVQPDLSRVDQVAKFLKKPDAVGSPSVTTSENGVQVLSAHHPVTHTGWAVVAEEPVASIFAPANDIAKITIFIFVTFGVISTGLSLLFSRNLTRPIRVLVAGTSQLGEGNLDMRIPVSSKDEIGVLAERFNTMAGNLKRLISNLKTESTKLNMVLNSVGEGIIATNYLNNIIVTNVSSAVLVGVLPTDLVGKPFVSFFPLLKNGQPFELNVTVAGVYKEIVFIDPNKRLHYLDILVNKISNDPNGITTIITLRDQTDEKELEMMKLDFVSMAAHELRTPLTAVRGYLGLLLTDEQSHLSEEGKQFVERAQASSKQLVGLISNLLNVSKIERGTLNMNYSKIDWTRTVQDAVNDQQFNAKTKHIELSYDGPTENVPLVVDELAIKEVVNNLIANAINYTGNDGHISVGVRIEDSKIITTVKDDGIGIPENAIDRLFTKFYRVKGGIASGSGGTGLGLYISKSIVELHNGKIWVDSEYGKGTTFSFSLPAYDEVQYEQLLSNQGTGVQKRHGWVTKNIAR